MILVPRQKHQAEPRGAAEPSVTEHALAADKAKRKAHYGDRGSAFLTLVWPKGVEPRGMLHKSASTSPDEDFS